MALRRAPSGRPIGLPSAASRSVAARHARSTSASEILDAVEIRARDLVSRPN